MLELGPNSGAVLVHGAVVGQGGEVLGVRYAHAWVEVNGFAMDYSNDRKFILPLPIFFQVGQIRGTDSVKYSYTEMGAAMVNHDHYGPWHDYEEDVAI